MIQIDNLIIKYSNKLILNASVEIRRGLLTGVVGESGSGKSSLLNVISLYNYNQDFSYKIDGVELKFSNKKEISAIKKTKICYLPQHPVFIDGLTCKENLLLECEISGCNNEKKIDSILSKVGLKGKEHVYPKALSGGEQQRLAIASALVKNGDLIICDEITASLDNANTEIILDILLEIARKENKYVILATHQKQVINACDVVFSIENNELNLIKKCEMAEEKRFSLDIGKTSKNSYLLRLANSRFKKNKLIFVLLLLVVSGVVAGMNYLFFWSNQRIVFQESLLKNYIQNELFILNNIAQEPAVMYISFFPPFDTNVVDRLGDNENIDKIYPLYSFSVGCNAEDSSDMTISVKDDIISKTQLITTNNIKGLHESVFPYYDEYNLSDLCIETTTNRNGVYINKRIAEMIGLEELQEGMTLTFELNIPVAIYDIPVTVYHGGSGNEEVIVSDETPTLDFNGIEYVYQTKRVTIPISGILPNSYTPLSVNTFYLMMLQYESMCEYINEAIDAYEYGNGEKVLDTGNIKIFYDKALDRQEVVQEIKEYGDNISIEEPFDNSVLIQKSINEVKRDFIIAFIIVSVLSTVLLIAYSFQHKKEVDNDDYYLNIHGISKNEKTYINIIEGLIIGSLVFCISLILVNIFLVYGLLEYKIIDVSGFEINYWQVIFVNLVFSFYSAIIIESSLLVKYN